MYAALTKLLELETTAPNDGAYKAAIASSLDTVLPSTPANSKRRAKRRPPTTPKASNFLPTVDAAGHHSPSASRAYKEGAQLAEAGMDFEASRRFLNGLSHAPDFRCG